jgi:hypothetical protein
MMINNQVSALGLATLEIIVHEKRNLSQPGYNKVVIITNELVDRVKGRAGDGIVTYPFLWDDAVVGLKSLGVDGKWNCVDITPEQCCADIKQSMYSIHSTRLIVLFLSIPMIHLINLFPLPFVNFSLYPWHWQVLPPLIREEIMLSVTFSSHLGELGNLREMIESSSMCHLMGECTNSRLFSKQLDSFFF